MSTLPMAWLDLLLPICLPSCSCWIPLWRLLCVLPHFPQSPRALPRNPTLRPRPALAEMSRFTIIPGTLELHPYSNPLMVPGSSSILVSFSPTNPGTSPKTVPYLC